MNGSVCVDSPLHGHICGQQEKHSAYSGTEPAWSLENVNKDYGWCIYNSRHRGQVCSATISERKKKKKAESSAKQH